MLVYLTGAAISTRKSTFAPDIAPQVTESRHLALIHRAEHLHSTASDGFSRKAHTLKVLRHQVQLRKTRTGGHVILVWLWLSDDSKARVAWLLGADEFALYRTWRRVAWEDLRWGSAGLREPPPTATYKVS
jgi:translation initiation factor IF-1